jgi:hypothetical protein
LGLDEAENRENERLLFAERNERFRDAGRKSLKSLMVRNRPFRRIVCFQWLDPLFVSPESQAPSGHMKRRAGRSVLKNSNRRPPVRQEKVDCLAGRPSLDRRASAAGGNCPNDPFDRIPYHLLDLDALD